MRRLKMAPVGVVLFASVVWLALASVSAHNDSRPRHLERWFKNRGKITPVSVRAQSGDQQGVIGHVVPDPFPGAESAGPFQALKDDLRDFREGKRL